MTNDNQQEFPSSMFTAIVELQKAGQFARLSKTLKRLLRGWCKWHRRKFYAPLTNFPGANRRPAGIRGHY